MHNWVSGGGLSCCQFGQAVEGLVYLGCCASSLLKGAEPNAGNVISEAKKTPGQILSSAWSSFAHRDLPHAPCKAPCCLDAMLLKAALVAALFEIPYGLAEITPDADAWLSSDPPASKMRV